MNKPSAFLSYRFRMFNEYASVLDMFERQGIAVVNRSIDAWNPSPLPPRELLASLDMRIRVATHVIVLVSDDLGDSPYCRAEIETAQRYGKPIIAMYPNGSFGAPMPRALGQGLYRAIGWRGNALERAIRGEYPAEARVFEISEDVERRRGIALVTALAAGTALLFAAKAEAEIEILRRDLKAASLHVPGPQQFDPRPSMAVGALGSLVLGGLLGARGPELLAGVAIGLAAGYGAGRLQHAQAELRRLGPLVEVRRQIAT